MPAHAPGHDGRSQVHEKGGCFIQTVKYQAVSQRRNTEGDGASTQPKYSLLNKGIIRIKTDRVALQYASKLQLVRQRQLLKKACLKLCKSYLA